MIVESLTLENFRNFDSLELNFNKGINFIYGPNGSGKTNLVEAIYYLSLTRSFRTNNEDSLINLKTDNFKIKARICRDFGSNYVYIFKNKEGKYIEINNKNIKKISEINKSTNCLIFSPKDVNLLKDLPKERRNFMNLLISKIDDEYLKDFIQFNKILKNRNAILKENSIDLKLLNVVTKQLIEVSKKLYSFRKRYLKKLDEALKNAYSKIAKDENKLIEIVYKPIIDNLKSFEEIATRMYKDSLEEDLKKKTTTIGVHKEDFMIKVNGKNVGIYGSQGENRIATLALKLAPYYLKENNKPIIILDDVLSELDDKHQSNLLSMLKDFEQVFITSTFKIENIRENIRFFKIDNAKFVKEGA